ncbi:hypothetical protein HMPREF0373_00591, partial [Eubacterium ramulus ATCC 29099]
ERFTQNNLHYRIVILPCIYIQYLFIYYNEIKGWSNASPTKMKIHIENKFTIFPILSTNTNIIYIIVSIDMYFKELPEVLKSFQLLPLCYYLNLLILY